MCNVPNDFDGAIIFVNKAIVLSFAGASSSASQLPLFTKPNDNFQLIVKLMLILNSEGACAPLFTSNESAKFIVVLSDKDSNIFCMGEWLSTTTNTHIGSSGINGLIGQIGLIGLVGISGLVG
jgi:hypothetical protein